MSRSHSKRDVPLIIEAPDATTEIFLIDQSFRRIASGKGRLVTKAAPGLYKIRFRSGATMTDKLVEIPQGHESVHVRQDPLAFRTAAPLAMTRGHSQVQREAAQRESLKIHAKVGSGSFVNVFIHNSDVPWTVSGVSLHAEDGSLVYDLREGTAVPQEGWVAANIEVLPGHYRLRVETHPLGTYEMFLVACPNWQTQTFLSVEELREGETRVRRPVLRSSSVLMARPHLGFQPTDPGARLADLSRLGLNSGRNVLSGEEVRRMLDGKFQNPMLGIYAGHMMLLEHRPDRSLLSVMCSNLRELLEWRHPDLESLALQVSEAEGTSAPFEAPPMLRRSWDLVVQANRRRPGLVSYGSLMDRVADGVVQAGPWLLWRLPEHELSAEITPARPKATLREARKWLHRAVDTTGASRHEQIPSRIPVLSSPLEENILRAIATRTIERSETRSSQQIETDLSGQLGIPLTSIRRSVRRLSEELDPDTLRPVGDSLEE